MPGISLGNALPPTPEPAASPKRSPAHYLWVVLIARIYEVFPLLCPKCGGHVLEGEMFPLDKGAAGRVILAIDDGVSGELYDQIRQQGFVITQKERDPESAAIACPVFANGSELLGAISLVIPFYRFLTKPSSGCCRWL